MNRPRRTRSNAAGRKDAFPVQRARLASGSSKDTSGKRSIGVNSKVDQETLADLLFRTGQGDREAFTTFYGLTSQRVYGLARKILVSVEIAQDITQEIYLLVWRQAHKYDTDAGSAMAWLMTITHRRAVDKVRAEQAGANRESHWGARTQGIEYDDVAVTVAARVETQNVFRCLGALSDIQREAISLAYYNCLTYREVAENLCTPPPTIKSRIRDGLKKLRTCLDQA